MFVVRRFVLTVLLVVSGILASLGAVPSAQAATVGLSDPQTGKIVSDDPANFTPHLLDGTAYSIVQVGSQIIVGGSFTSVRDQSGDTTPFTRNHVVAFDATTGKINRDFNPAPNGTVYKVQQVEGQNAVYIGGNFTSAGGAAHRDLFKYDFDNSRIDPSFAPPTIDGAVRDLEVVGNHLFVSGKFTHLGGTAQRALGTLNATTGKYDSFFTSILAGKHRPDAAGDVTDVLQMSSNPQNTQLTAVGNFTSVDGQVRSQIATFDIGGATATLSPWFTNLFTQGCSSKFDTYMSDVEYSPDGSYFIVSTTGAYGGSASNGGTSGCDVVARWETGGTTGPTPATWTAYTGGDTTWNIEVTDNVIYAGGHQRWQNNPTRGDEAGQGAVARTGIAALNPLNGMPYSWNPTRTRGVGIQDMLATPQGLWVGSDTDRIGKGYEFHSEIALMPLAGGKTLPAEPNATLPGTVYSVPTASSTTNRRAFDGTAPGSVSNFTAGANNPSWGNVTGAFMVNGTLYTTFNTGTRQLMKQSFNGSTYGTATAVNAADAIVPQTDWHNTDVPNLTSLFFYNGRIFFTKSGSTSLFRRGFEPESDIVGQQRFTTNAVSGINYSNIRGAFVANGKFYYALSNGQLWRADWSGTSPVGGTQVQVSGPGKDAQTWNSRAMFVYQASGQQTNTPPIADADVHCDNGLTCSFDASNSSDPDGSVSSYLWEFGDGQTSTDAVTQHTYATSGPRTVKLTVTDNEGTQSSTTVNINPQAPAGNQPPVAVANVSCTLLHCDFNTNGSSDSDGTITSVLWDFGDTNSPDNSSTDATTSHDYTAAGQYTAKLTLTDDDGDSTTVQKQFTVSDTASPVALRGVDETNGNRTSHTVTIPAGTQAGDTMVLFFSSNTTNPTYTYPAGWTPITGGTLNGTGFLGRAFTRTATAGDAGTLVRVTSSALAKSDMALAVYSGSTGVAASAGKLENGPASSASHTSPTVDAPVGSKWLVTYFVDKSSATTAWTTRPQTFRSSKVGTSGGHMAGLLVDSAPDVSGHHRRSDCHR